MRFGATRRFRVPRYAPAAAAAAVVAVFSTTALADIVFTPIFGIEQIFTDNVRASSIDRDADGVTVASVRLEALLTTSRINAIADVGLFYNEFWATDALDNLNGAGTIAGRAEVLRNFLFVDAIASKQDVYLSPNDVSASGLTTGQGTLQQTNYGVSPFIATDLFGIADLLVRGNYAEVKFDEPVVGIAATLLTDIAVKQAGARLGTGQRSSLYEIVGTAEYLETDLGFEQRNVIGGLIFNITRGLAAIGRIGYERISDPSFPIIRETVWTLGGRFSFNKSSSIQVEFGRRFGDDTLLAAADVALTPRLRMVGTYTDALIPVQLTLVRTVTDLLDQDGNFITAPPNSPSIPDPLLVDAIVRDKDVRLATVYTRDLQTVTLTLGHTERFYPSLLDDESFYFIGLTMAEKLSRRLEYVLNVRFTDNYATLATRTPSEIYNTEFSLIYQYNEDIAFGGGYAWRLQTGPTNFDTYENILRFSISQTF